MTAAHICQIPNSPGAPPSCWYSQPSLLLPNSLTAAAALSLLFKNSRKRGTISFLISPSSNMLVINGLIAVMTILAFIAVSSFMNLSTASRFCLTMFLAYVAYSLSTLTTGLLSLISPVKNTTLPFLSPPRPLSGTSGCPSPGILVCTAIPPTLLPICLPNGLAIAT